MTAARACYDPSVATPLHPVGKPPVKVEEPTLDIPMAEPVVGGFGWDRYAMNCQLYGPGGVPNWDGLGEVHVPGACDDF